MPDEVRASQHVSRPTGAAVRSDFGGMILKAVVAVLVLIAFWSFVSVLRDEGISGWQRLQALMLPASVIAVAVFAAMRHERKWASPSKQLARVIPQIRAGAEPIERLSNIEGGLVEVVAAVQELLRDLRQQKQAVAELNEEIRQRIATRTDALERQLGSLRQQASRDALTGLYNRRMLDTLLPRLVERCHEDRLELSLLMVDVDYFKQLNDTFGHTAGDELLRDIGKLIRSGLRESEMAFRYGGDEFVIVMPGASLDVAQATSDRLNSLVMALTKPLRVANPPRLSIGISLLSQIEEPTPQLLLEEADRHLYDVKAARRKPRSACA